MATNTLALSTAAPRLALYAEQTSPGEDCVAVLTSTAGPGEALLRVRGALEGAGANVVLLDRTFSMERSLTGAGAPAAPDQTRVAALRPAVAAMLSAITLVPEAGAWAFLPFTSDVQSNLAAPLTGFAAPAAVSNPDNPSSLHVVGFAGATADVLDPGGPGNLVQAMRTSLPRLSSADLLVPSPGLERRLWVLTDGVAGAESYGYFPTLLPSMLSGAVSLHLLSVGSLENDPLAQQMAALGSRLTGERPFGPVPGNYGPAHSKVAFVENTMATLIHSVLHGRPVGTAARGPMQQGQDLTTTFMLTKDKTTGFFDDWALYVAAYEDADATVSLQILAGGQPVNQRCLYAPNIIICAAIGYNGQYKVTLSGSRPGGAPTQGVLRAFVSTALNAGEVGFVPSFGRSLNRTGDQLRVALTLTERGLPLLGATVTAQITGPSGAIGTLVAQGSASQSDIGNLIAQDGDLSPGQAKGELLDPSTLPAPKSLEPLTLDDQATGGDLQPDDGVYTGQFNPLLPGVYVIDLHADYSGMFGNMGSIEDRIITQVVLAIDQTMTSNSVHSEVLGSGALRLRFTPQDAGQHLLGPGQASALSFAQGSAIYAPLVEDYLDGSYRADVLGMDLTQPLMLVTPGSRIQIWAPGSGMSSGCTATRRADTSPRWQSAAGLLLLMVSLAPLLRRRRRGA